MTEPMECPICMDVIGDKNNITTECGHRFHASCIMTNVSHNGFNCPCCRAVMADEDDEEDEDDDFLETIDSAGDLNTDDEDEEELHPSEDVLSCVLSSEIPTEDFIRYILYDEYGYSELEQVYEDVSSKIVNIVERLKRNEEEDEEDEEDDEDETLTTNDWGENENEDEDEDYGTDEGTHDEDGKKMCKLCIPHLYVSCGSERCPYNWIITVKPDCVLEQKPQEEDTSIAKLKDSVPQLVTTEEDDELWLQAIHELEIVLNNVKGM